VTAPDILILTNGPLCRNPRVWKEAQTLAEAGLDVHVLGVRHRQDSEADDLALLRRARFTRSLVDMAAGFDEPAWVTFTRRLRQRAGVEAVARMGLHTSWAIPATGALLARARAIPARLTIVHNEAPHWVGWQLMKEGRRVAADIEDWHSEDLLPELNRCRPLHVLRAQEAALLRHAVYTTVPSQAMADALHTRYGGIRPEVLPNVFPLQPDPLQRTAGDPPAFYWFSQTVGPGRGLELFLRAWARMRRTARLVLQGECSPPFADQLRGLLPPERRGTLEFLPLVSPDALPSAIACHDIGLALEEDSIPNRDLTTTNKILQYLNAGLAVLATPTRGQREVLDRNPQAGALIDLQNPEALARTLDGLTDDRTGLEVRRRSARRLAEEQYCWEIEGPRHRDRIRRALESSP
jgi:glycosyltransferase involved in cell wall biosynthesis